MTRASDTPGRQTAARAFLDGLDPHRPVLIAGPTASGKSGLALAIAETQGGVVVNADALQVYANWRVLTARPGPADEARAPHLLYGHVGRDQSYSVGHWLRDLDPVLRGGERPIIVGGTGLYFSALTEGLATIPPIPPETRRRADALMAEGGLAAMVAAIEPETRARIDCRNPARVQRAWEVQEATGRGLAAWQARTAPPLLPLALAQPVVLEAGREWLGVRIAARFRAMLEGGALDEVRAEAPHWRPGRPSSRAIGAAELIAHLAGAMPLDAAEAAAVIATRQYAKRQRSWFRNRLGHWPRLAAESLP